MANLRGITTIELIIVLSLVSMLIAGTSIAGMRLLLGSRAQEDQMLLETALRLARARAQLGEAHGVSITETTFIVFEGISFEERDPDSDFTFSRTGDTPLLQSTAIVFAAGSGRIGKPVSIKNAQGTYRLDIALSGSLRAYGP